MSHKKQSPYSLLKAHFAEAQRQYGLLAKACNHRTKAIACMHQGVQETVEAVVQAEIKLQEAYKIAVEFETETNNPAWLLLFQEIEPLTRMNSRLTQLAETLAAK